MINKSRVSLNFSKAAKFYDKHALLQSYIARELLEKIKEIKKPAAILDIGCGAARLTENISSIFPDSELYALDYASGMLAEARKKYDNLFLIQADANDLPFKAESFDLIVSNLAYQWVDDLDGAFCQVHNILKNEGRFLATIFGRDTLKELRLSYFKASRNKNLDYRRMSESKDIRNALLKSGFKSIKIKRTFKKENYNDLFCLIKWLKATGSNYSVTSNLNSLGSRRFLNKLSDIYESRYRDNGSIYASFEVIYVEAQK